MAKEDFGLAVATKRTASWRQLVIHRAERDRAELAGHISRDGCEERCDQVLQLLHRAEQSADQPATLGRWWTGSSAELAWLSLHEAEAQIDGLLTGPELVCHARDVSIKAKAMMKPDDLRLKLVEKALAASDPAAELDAAAVAHLARAVYRLSDEEYAQSRTYRNRLIRLGLLSLAAFGLVVAAFATNAISIPIKGDKEPSNLETMLLISLFGAVGALITSVPPLAKISGTWNPFSLPLYQMLLKVALGPVLAVIGVMLLQSKLIPNVDFPMPLPDLLVWALVFGAAQQTVTGGIDKRVAGLVTDPANAQPSAAGGAAA